MRKIFVTVMFSVVAAGSALAADLSVRPAPAPRVVYVYDWTGGYIGINGGWAIGTSNWSAFGPPLITLPPGVSGTPGTTGDFNASGGLVGGTLGYNWQFGYFVVGLEGDFDGQWLDGTSGHCAPVACETKSTWLSTLRGRFGYAADRVLFYATAGGAIANIEANTGFGTVGTFQSETKGGWTAGGGIEGAFTDHWTARIEYLYVGLQNASGFNTLPGPTTVKLNENVVRAAVVYKF
jgi:outer membrane immunogenic protein